MRRKDMMPFAPKEYYPLHEDIKKLLLADETKEEVDAYFEHIAHCVNLEICASCGHALDYENDNYRAEHHKEYSISGLCIHCQIKAFGL